MTHRTEILAFLEDIRPDGRCDDCLSDELDIKPRQSINMTCRPLADAGDITRFKVKCSRCGKVKLVNSFARSHNVQKVRPSVVLQERDVTTTGTLPVVNVESVRTDIVRMCRKLWDQTRSDERPRSISAVITQLKSSGQLPYIQASLMLTLCTLRNASVYEGYELREHEAAVVRHASAALIEWWSEKEVGS